MDELMKMLGEQGLEIGETRELDGTEEMGEKLEL